MRVKCACKSISYVKHHDLETEGQSFLGLDAF